jgi:hypothetical protein
VTACGRVGCDREARWRVGLSLGRRGHDGSPALAWLGIAVCQPHRDSTSASDYISDEGWATICEGMASSGAMIPDRASTELIWSRLGSPGDDSILAALAKIRKAQST